MACLTTKVGDLPISVSRAWLGMFVTLHLGHKWDQLGCNNETLNWLCCSCCKAECVPCMSLNSCPRLQWAHRAQRPQRCVTSTGCPSVTSRCLGMAGTHRGRRVLSVLSMPATSSSPGCQRGQVCCAVLRGHRNPPRGNAWPPRARRMIPVGCPQGAPPAGGRGGARKRRARGGLAPAVSSGVAQPRPSGRAAKRPRVGAQRCSRRSGPMGCVGSPARGG